MPDSRQQLRDFIAQVGLRDASIKLRTSQVSLDAMAKHGTPVSKEVERRVAVGNALAGVPPRRSVRAELPHTAPTSGAWRRSVRSGTGAGPGPWESNDRRVDRTAPTSSGFADF